MALFTAMAVGKRRSRLCARVECGRAPRARPARTRDAHPTRLATVRLLVADGRTLPRLWADHRVCPRNSGRLGSCRRGEPIWAPLVRARLRRHPTRTCRHRPRLVARWAPCPRCTSPLRVRGRRVWRRPLGRAPGGGGLALSREPVACLLQEIVAALDAGFGHAGDRDADRGGGLELSAPELA